MRFSVRSGFGFAGLAVLLLSGAAAADDLDARIAQAQEFTSAKLSAKVLNAAMAFNWIGDSGRFWYKKALDANHDGYFLVDAAAGQQTALFDAQKMDAALAAAGAASGGGVPRFRETSVSDDQRAITVGLTKPGWTCLGPAGCEVPVNRYQCDLPVTSCKALPAALAKDSVLSPDGKFRAFARDHNLWLQDMASKAERQLTRDGVENFAYGEVHDQDDTLAATRRRAGLPESLKGVRWSPDGRYLLVLRHDLRNTKVRLVLTEYLPPEGGPPIIHTRHVAAAGDPTFPEAAVDVISVADGAIHHVNADPHLFEEIALRYFIGDGTGLTGSASGFWWNPVKDEVWIIGTKRVGLEERLLHIDLRTGAAKNIIVETGKKPIRLATTTRQHPSVEVLRGKRQVLWWSERDGWGHFYLYDADTGRLIRQVTSGQWLVADLLHVDEAKRMVYFSGVGKETGRNLVYRHLYKVSLDGGTPQLLTPEEADHADTVSPDGRYVVDDYSTTSEPDQYVLRKTDGALVSRIAQADISALTQMGWKPPERVTVKADDGKTDLYGVIYKPRNFDPGKKYPIIEITYPGVWSKFAPTSFREVFNGSTSLNAHAFAEMGAVVVAVDGRGTAYRSAAFRDAFIGTDDPAGAVDHVAAIRNMAATRPYMDLSRIGVTGHSSGGDGSLRAMMLFPDFFKVAVSGEVPSDYMEMQLGAPATERPFGMSGGTPEGRAYYERVAVRNLVSRLTPKNKVLIIGAGADEQVPLQQVFELFQAFQDAGFLYDELIIPGAGHSGGRTPYGVMRNMRYFAENLGGPR